MIPLIDTHVHFWNRRDAPAGLRWNWVEPGDDHPILGDIDAMKAVKFTAESLWAEARFSAVTGAVHVQAAIGSEDPVLETAWLTDMAAVSALPLRIVAHADLTRADLWPRQLDGHSRSPLFVGVRDFAVEPMLASGSVSASLTDALGELARRGLVLDLDCEWPNMAAAARLAAAHPEVTIVLEHIGFPRSRDDAYFSNWSTAIAELAQASNVYCKLSGLGMTDRAFTRESLSRWLDTCLELFGPDRCVVGSNWPLDRVASSYDAIMNVYRDAISALPLDAQQAVLADNASRIYNF